MGNKYGIVQSSLKSCIFYKQDEDGNQSTFNIFLKPNKNNPDKEEIFAFIDNEQFKKENWINRDESDIKDVLDAFGGWASEAPMVFEMEAHRSLNNCLSSLMKKEE